MARLIQMRQRIKAIETIQKITHAMRLISMSAHTRMQGKKHIIEQYKITALNLLTTAYHAHPSWQSSLLQPKTEHQRRLVIVIGSQKGLCGNFNTMLFSFFESKELKDLDKDLHSIAIGKKAADFLSAHKELKLVHQYTNFSSSRIPFIANNLITLLTTTQPRFSSVTIVSNHLKNFFVQQPRITELIPFSPPKNNQHLETYRWEQPIEKIFSALTHEYLYAQIYYLLFESLLAEQATRFIAMDNSTRNADQLLDDMNLMYNKLRQAKITRELTELMASF